MELYWARADGLGKPINRIRLVMADSHEAAAAAFDEKIAWVKRCFTLEHRQDADGRPPMVPWTVPVDRIPSAYDQFDTHSATFWDDLADAGFDIS